MHRARDVTALRLDARTSPFNHAIHAAVQRARIDQLLITRDNRPSHVLETMLSYPP